MLNLAIVDLETTSLKADRGFVICGGIKPLGGTPKILGIRDIGPSTSRYNIDRRVVAAIRDEMLKYDGWITWNGLLYDLPYLNDRLMICGERPLEKRFARGLDMMWHAKLGKSTMTSARLDWVAKMLKCPFKKTDLDFVTWQDAETEVIRKFAGGSESYNHIVTHNNADLFVTEWVFDKLKHRIQTISKY